MESQEQLRNIQLCRQICKSHGVKWQSTKGNRLNSGQVQFLQLLIDSGVNPKSIYHVLKVSPHITRRECTVVSYRPYRKNEYQIFKDGFFNLHLPEGYNFITGFSDGRTRCNFQKYEQNIFPITNRFVAIE